MSTLKLATAATFEHISLAQARLHIAEDSGVQDDLITAWIAAARQRVEQDTHRILATSTWDLYMDDFPACDTIVIPTAPVTSITSVNYTAEGAAEAAFSTAFYNSDVISSPARVRLKSSQTWPTATLETVNAVRVRFVAGYAQGSLPEPLFAAMLLLIGHWYENREASIVGNPSAAESKALIMGYSALVNPYRLASGWGI